MSTHIVSRTERRRIIATLFAAALLVLAGSVASKAAELNPETLKAWNEYIQAENSRLAKCSHASSFLWSDQSPDRIRRLHEGEILVAPMGENPRSVPHGLIHHWIGAVFLANTGLDDVFAVVRDYSRYKDFYAPDVIDSRLLRQADTDDAFSLRILNKALLSKFALDAEFRGSYAGVDKSRWYSVGYSTRIREVENYGQAEEHELPPNTGRGFIWRLYNVSRFEERDGGVYVELEAIALSRDVPAAVHWLVNPMIRRVSRGSMLVSLQKTQEAVFARNDLASGTAKKDEDIAQKAAFSRKAPAPPLQNGFAPRRPF
jgi:hypothetical protein